jgi:Grx4 family monothiol glutaredoxin
MIRFNSYIDSFLQFLQFFHFIVNAVQDGVVVDKMQGANPPELASKVAKWAGSVPVAAPVVATATKKETPAAAASQDTAKVSLAEAEKGMLHDIVTSKKIMLFMKGTPEEPRCGFSRKVVNVLKEQGVEFGSFDILSDERVRQGMKTYANWPTFPQLYVKGELLGGCDIILEMNENGELKEVSSFHFLVLLFFGLTPKRPLCIFCSVGILDPLLQIICLCENDYTIDTVDLVV